MKVRIEAECTPEEARAFLGLPDVTPFNQHVVAEMTRKLDANSEALKPEELMRNWANWGGQAQDQFRTVMQTVLAAAATSRASPGRKAGVTDTIFARATAGGRGAIAIVRISGPGSGPALVNLAGGLPEPRKAVVRSLRSVAGELLDEAMVLWTPGPASFTGEDCAELHIHGGSAVFHGVAQALIERGLRAADAGEFSRRAFANGKLDLLQAEAVADLVDAETDAQRRQALAQMSGRVGRRYEAWQDELTAALALLEAENDFPDEDLPGALAEQAVRKLAGVQCDLEAALASAARGRAVREGYRVALIGEPNAGKSSLFNALLARQAAIVSSTPGTTRDVVEGVLSVGGHTVVLADTAGVRQAADKVESEGVRRAAATAHAASVRIVLVDRSVGQISPMLSELARAGDLLVLSKSDVSLETVDVESTGLGSLDIATCSTVTRGGLDGVMTWLAARVMQDLDGAEPPPATRARHQTAISSAADAVVRARACAGETPEKAVEDIRIAAQALRSIIGEVDRESVLDQVFSSFCIGK